MKKAFTITELIVAIGLLAAVLAASTMIFHYAIEAQRTAMATAEIMRNMRAITDQLNSDFAGLRKDGEIFVIWDAEPNLYRADRIMFFANGDFQSYGIPLVGNLARISYMLAKRGDVEVSGQLPEKRILARTQHIFTADAAFPNVDPATFTVPKDWFDWHNGLEYDKMTMEQWKNMPLSLSEKAKMLSVIMEVRVDASIPDNLLIGANINPSDPNSIHMLLCQGVGEFKVQGWYAAQKRWVPETPDFNGLAPTSVPGVLYPDPPNGQVILGGAFFGNNFKSLLNEENFDSIPGLGRALKFTFTLYDSKGILKTGRTFEHIVYIGN